METKILERVKIRLPSEDNDTLLNELIETVKDRILLRVGESTLPPLLNSICIDCVIKVYRRQYFEGVSDEWADSLKLSFFEDVLKEYDEEIEAYKQMKKKEADATGKKKVVKFI